MHPQTLQRGLPRPMSIDKLPQPKAPTELEAMSLRERAEAELYNELAALVQHDNTAHPLSSSTAAAGAAGGSSKKRKKGRHGEEGAEQQQQQQQLVPKGPPLVQYSLAEMDAVREMLGAEVEVVRAAMGHSGAGEVEYLEAWRAVVDDFVVDEQVGVGVDGWGGRAGEELGGVERAGMGQGGCVDVCVGWHLWVTLAAARLSVPSGIMKAGSMQRCVSKYVLRACKQGSRKSMSREFPLAAKRRTETHS